MSREFKLPDLGEGITEAQIVRVLIQNGADVKEDQPILEVETDKAAVEIPSPIAGKVLNVHVKEGQTVAVGDVMITFGTAGETAAAAPAPAAKAATPAPAAKAASSSSAPASSGRTATAAPPSPPAAAPPPPMPIEPAGRSSVAAAPAVRKLARDMGINIDTLAGTGPGGRVTKEDVERAAGTGAPARSDGARPSSAPAVAARREDAMDMPSAAPTPSHAAAPPPIPPGVMDADKWGSVRRVPLTQIRKTIAQQMVRSAYTIPHVTGFDFADITELENLRKSINSDEKAGRKATVLAFVIKALANVFPRHPIFNASYDHEKQEILYKDYINIGIAVDTERGLVVLVVRNVEKMSLGQIMDALKETGEKARSTKFGIEDMRGGTFTITNVGAFGGTFFTPIINYPESAILGMGKAKWMPWVVDGEIKPRFILPIGLTIDHRIADGAQSARCLNEIIELLEHPTRFLTV